MQTFKHLSFAEREAACIAWYERSAARQETDGGNALQDMDMQAPRMLRIRDLRWYEFACAAGSQFQVYVPLFLLFAHRSGVLRRCYDAYFPAVAALHVLLDSFIDQAEDREHGELNFVECYASFEDMSRRVAFLANHAYTSFDRLPNPYQHRFLLRVMALFYLTHPKIAAQHLDLQAAALLKQFET
jgi:tetraprenyl-beta-curcumene synthase